MEFKQFQKTSEKMISGYFFNLTKSITSFEKHHYLSRDALCESIRTYAKQIQQDTPNVNSTAAQSGETTPLEVFFHRYRKTMKLALMTPPLEAHPCLWLLETDSAEIGVHLEKGWYGMLREEMIFFNTKKTTAYFLRA